VRAATTISQRNSFSHDVLYAERCVLTGVVAYRHRRRCSGHRHRFNASGAFIAG